MIKKIKGIFQMSADVKMQFADANAEEILKAASIIASAFNEGKKLMLFGNGGSANDASHIAAEFVGRFKLERPGLPALALNTDMAIITAVSNDYDFSEVFSRQIKALAVEGDVAIGISTSGASKNVLKALDAAKRKKLKTMLLTGAKGMKIASKFDVCFVVPSEVTARIQETHITIGHALCQIVEELLFEAHVKG